MEIQIKSRGSKFFQERYKDSIQQVLEDIKKTYTGRIVIEFLEQSRHRVIINPYTDSNKNADARAGNALSAGSYRVDKIASGSGSRIRFSVERSVMHNKVQGRADEVLLHELAHAVRHVSGTQRYSSNNNGGFLLWMASFGNVEEFFAAMVASIHSSELGRPPLGNHGIWRLRNPEILQERPYITRLREICSRLPFFTKKIASIPRNIASFNPFRDNVHNSIKPLTDKTHKNRQSITTTH